MNKRLLIVGGLIGLVILGAVGWYLGSPLFIDRTVEEDFPFEVPSEAQLAAMSEEEKAAVEAELVAEAATMPDKVMEDAMPEAEAEGDAPVVVLQGQFKNADDFHQGSGTATIYELPDGSHVLRFEDFSVTNGPDLHVLLASHPDPQTSDELHENYIDLGAIKGNKGNQNYEIPVGTDISQFNSVVIYCQPFHVFFSNAPLSS